MKTVSLRAFRDSLGKVDPEAEPVDVVVRRDGYLITLGQWTPTSYALAHPFGQAAHVARAFDVPLTTVTSPEERDRLARGQPLGTYAGRPFTPVPKPGRK